MPRLLRRLAMTGWGRGFFDKLRMTVRGGRGFFDKLRMTVRGAQNDSMGA